MNDYLYHHGIRGQKWGVRNGPPYPLKGRRVTRSGYKLKYKTGYKNYDIKKGSKTQTLSYDKNRIEGADMYYAALTPRDKNFYKTFFNKAIPNDEVDENGKRIGPSTCLKYNIQTEAARDLQVANEDQGVQAFIACMESSRDFSNFVLDKSRMKGVMDPRRQKFPAYKEALKVLDDIELGNGEITDAQMALLYRVFNYVIPAEGSDVKRQRARFFKELKDEGFSAVLDINDAEYGKFKREMPVVIFDTDSFVFTDADRVSLADKRVSQIKTFFNTPF